MTVQSDLDKRELSLLGLFAQGHIVSSAADEMGIAAVRAARYRDRMFDALGVKSIFSAVTIGYLSCMLPAPAGIVPAEQNLL